MFQKNKNLLDIYIKICIEMACYCEARADCIDLYEQMLRVPTSWQIKDLEDMTKEILEKYKETFTSKIMFALKVSMQFGVHCF